jgi:beta-lactamase regulating signal transducer with metallopeptidase domain/biopolymer transport protein ExbD
MSAQSARSIIWLTILLDASVKGVIVLALAGALSVALRRASAASRHLVWSLALVSLIGLPVLSAVLPSWQVPILPRQVPAVAAEPEDTTSGRSGILPDMEQETPPGRMPGRPVGMGYSDPASAVMAKQTETHVAPSARLVIADFMRAHWSALLLLAWVLGGVGAILPLLVGLVAVLGRTRRATQVVEGVCAKLLAELSEQLDVRRRVRLLESDDASVPTTWGVLRPVVLLPSEARNWPEERCRMVLLHELAHIRRRDWLTQTVGRVACAVHWFNPLVWLAARRLRLESEQACDDALLRAGYKASGYAHQLLELVRTLRPARCASLATVPMARSSRIEKRLTAILDAKRNRRALTHVSIALALIVVSCTVMPLAALRPTARNAQAEEPGLSPEPVPAAERETMLKQIGLALKMYAGESQGGRFPAKTSEPGAFHPEMKGLVRLLDEGGADASELIAYLKGQRGVKVCYLGYVVTDEQFGLALLEEISGYTDKELPHDVHVSRAEGGYDTIYLLREGIERFLITDINNPAAAAATQSIIPVVWEVPDANDGDGGWVLYMDGHVEWKSYPGEFPMTERFVARLRELMASPGPGEDAPVPGASFARTVRATRPAATPVLRTATARRVGMTARRRPAAVATTTTTAARAPWEPEQGAEIAARPLTAADREIFDELVQFARIADRRFSDIGDYRWRAALYHVRSENEATVWEMLRLRRRPESGPEEVAWGSSQEIDAKAEYYLPDGTPLESRWEPRGDGMHDIYIDVGSPVPEGEGVPVVSRHRNAPDQFLMVPGTQERRFEFSSWTDNPGAWIVRLDAPLERTSWYPGEADSWHRDEYTELTWLLPPGPDGARGYVNFTVPAEAGSAPPLVYETELATKESRERFNYERALNAEASRTISSLDYVRSARVRVTIPEDALFEEDQEEPSASALVELTEPGTLTQEQVEAIRHLVAAGIEDLKERNVTVVDKQGTVLAAPDEPREIIIDITENGTIVVNGKQYDLASLQEMLNSAPTAFKGQAVVIRADTRTQSGKVVEVLNACTKADIRNVSCAALEERETARIEGEPFAVPGERTIRFPEDRSMGKLYARDWGLEGTAKWDELGDAVGNVEIPAGKEVRLLVSKQAVHDLSPLAPLAPDDIQELAMGFFPSSNELEPTEFGKRILPVSPFELSEGVVLDDELAHIEGLTGLKRLGLSGFPVTNAGLAYLSGLTSLEELRFGKEAMVLYMNGGWLIYENREITDSGLVHLKDLRSLHTLDLTGTNVEGPGLAHLKGLTSLRNLYLTRTRVDAAGLEYLKALTSLHYLDLRDTQVTGSGIEHPEVEDLWKALPACKIRAGGVTPPY